MNNEDLEFFHQCLQVTGGMFKALSRQDHWSSQWTQPLIPLYEEISSKYGLTDKIKTIADDNNVDFEQVMLNSEDHFIQLYFEGTKEDYPNLSDSDVAFYTIHMCLNTLEGLLEGEAELDIESLGSIKVFQTGLQTQIETMRNLGATQL